MKTPGWPRVKSLSTISSRSDVLPLSSLPPGGGGEAGFGADEVGERGQRAVAAQTGDAAKRKKSYIRADTLIDIMYIFAGGCVLSWREARKPHPERNATMNKIIIICWAAILGIAAFAVSRHVKTPPKEPNDNAVSAKSETAAQEPAFLPFGEAFFAGDECNCLKHRIPVIMRTISSIIIHSSESTGIHPVIIDHNKL